MCKGPEVGGVRKTVSCSCWSGPSFCEGQDLRSETLNDKLRSFHDYRVIDEVVQGRTLEEDGLGSDPGCAADWLCELGQITRPPCSSLSSSVTWSDNCPSA